MNASPYDAQTALMVRCIPAVAPESDFALKGGSALNLFEFDLPRLSIDIDLAFVPVLGRADTLRRADAALGRIADRLARLGVRTTRTVAPEAPKLLCMDGTARIKIEPNLVLRGTVFPVRQMHVAPAVEERFGFAEAPVLSRGELVGGKLCAALDRQHPRDLFDAARIAAAGFLDDEARLGFLVAALSHNRPLHELLAPRPQNRRDVFESQFRGMTRAPFSYAGHEAAFRALSAFVRDWFTAGERAYCRAFVALENPSEPPVSGLDALPAIRWKLENLKRLRDSNPEKFHLQSTLLAQVLPP